MSLLPSVTRFGVNSQVWVFFTQICTSTYVFMFFIHIPVLEKEYWQKSKSYGLNLVTYFHVTLLRTYVHIYIGVK
jgi:hypothetical protein